MNLHAGPRKVLSVALDYAAASVSAAGMLVLTAVAVSLVVPAPREAEDTASAPTTLGRDDGAGERLVQIPSAQLPVAGPSCVRTNYWTNSAGDTWTFTRCSDTVSVRRGGGPAGPCAVTYPVGQQWVGPESDCAYDGPKSTTPP